MHIKKLKRFLYLKHHIYNGGERPLMVSVSGHDNHDYIVEYNQLLPQFEKLKDTIVAEAIEQYEAINYPKVCDDCGNLPIYRKGLCKSCWVESHS
jgi:hypothetical protein